ncbi:MAG: M6 family metalloprotease domain-containing protein, partial [Planctomycetes bacterium]|nr:M6 family metalloprotease domain-containing protein [Planctomycetota bacterium]
MSRIRGSCLKALRFATLVWVCVMPLRATGEPVFGEVFRVLQPDASPVDVRIWGDEFYQVMESLDGFTLTRDPANGLICYAQLSRDGTALVSTGLSASFPAPHSLGLQPHLRIASTAAHAQAQAARARFYPDTLAASAEHRDSFRATSPTLGNVVGLCLIVDFADDPATSYGISPGEVRAFCNDVGYTGFGNNGSVRDYYYDVSDGALTFTQFVPDAYYRAPETKLYYTDRSWPFGIRARELVLDALYALEDSGFAFDDYDANDDGVIDGISCLYAGPRHSPWGEGLWPHTWDLDFAADGVTANKYAISDMYLDTGDVQYYLRLSTFCHEVGHMMFDWPDLYDRDFDSAGVGAYCIMAGHNNYTAYTNPQEPCAYLKYLAGWSTTTVLSTPQFGLPVPAGVNAFYKYEHPTAGNEYFLIENRQQLGRDLGLPDAGLAVWHIDTLGSNDDQQMTPAQHYEVTLIQADGQWDLETNTNNGDSTDLWSAPGYSELTPYTTPDTRWWDGSNSRLYLRDISTADPMMAFAFFTGEDCNDNSIPDEEDLASGTSSDCNTNTVPDECDIDQEVSLDCNDTGIPDECELADNDCNGTGTPDDCDIAAGVSLDCQPNGSPDECELSGNDCNANAVPDDCELPGNDCN